MKQILTTLMWIAAVIMFTACGGSSNKKASDGKTTLEDGKQVIETSVLGDMTKSACEAAFNGIGLTLDQVKPDYKYLDVDTLNIYHGVANRGRYEGSIVFIKEDMTDVSREEFESYIRKMYSVTQEIADEGKVIYGFERKSALEEATAVWPVDEILAQKILGFPLSSLDWGFKRNDKFMSMNVELLDANKKYPARLQVHFSEALQKSFDDTMKDAEKALEDPEVQKALEDALKK